MSALDEVQFAVRGRVGWITLNRPAALNALTHGMAKAMTARLADWMRDPAIVAVVVEGAGGRAFCAGGDIRVLYDAMRRGGRLTHDYYRDEYRLNRRIAVYPKPYIALVDGVVMGGGVGVSVHGRYRVVGDRALFAMPETGIGLFPDVGATYVLPRMPGEIGTYLGLTGTRLGAADCLYAGFATHAVPSTDWPALTAALTDGDIGPVLDAHARDPGPPPLAAYRAAIDRCFAGESIAAILDALATEGGTWAEATRSALLAKAPTSLKVTLRQLRLGRRLDLDAGIRTEFRLSQRFVAGWDFPEGVRAVIIDRDNRPRWRPESLAAVSDAMVDGYFAPLDGGDLTFDEDPHG
ncbi:MAG: enoyl-CoA hydratase/isomerase family protein [Alphaproteobacteria bacterium]|nr:enoyl-CoA hydratase/isomerase family protein [Alphaproteobacteria bacterium]